MSYKKITDFIHDLYGAQDFVPLAVPVFIGNEKKYLNECIDTTFVSSVGKFVDRFEKDTARYTGCERAVVCVSGTNALHMSLMLAGVEREDEVLTQALTFIATCNALSYIGAYPVFIDVDKDTMGLSPVAVREWLVKNSEQKNGECYNKRTGRRVKACVPMHTEFLSGENLYKLRMVTDIFVHVQTTDAFSGSVQEYILCKKKIVQGAWIKYELINDIRPLFYFPVDKMENLGEVIVKAYNSENISIPQEVIDYVKGSGWDKKATMMNNFFMSLV